MATFSRGYVFFFAGIICVVCSVSVAGVSMSLRDMQELNKERDLKNNILSALGLPEDGSTLEGEAIDEAWKASVQQRFITPAGAEADLALDFDQDGQLDNDDLTMALEKVEGTTDAPPLMGVYVRMEGTELKSLAIPMDGEGLWGPLSGYLALDTEAAKVTGATFFAPKETPGLGAEIMETPFESMWIGKEIIDDAGRPKPIRVVKGQAQNLCPTELEHCVDGVSGATITSRGVDEMVAEALEWYDPFLSKLRGG